MGSKKQKQGICEYCGANGPVEREHVISRKFFLVSERGNLPIIPACSACNREGGDGKQRNMSDDEQYVMSVLPWMYECGGHPSASPLIRGDIRERLMSQPGLGRRFLSNTREEPVTLSSGILLPRALVFDVDVERIDRVVRKWVRGLFAYEFGTRLPEDTNFEIQSFVPRERCRIIAQMFKDAPYVRTRNLASDVFEYGVMLQPQYPHITAWLLSYFRGFNAFVRTVSKRPVCDVEQLWQKQMDLQDPPNETG